MPRKYRDLASQKFGRLTATRHLGEGMWQCECECGRSSVTSSNKLINGKQVSCGCYLAEARLKHGMSGTAIHQVWRSMRARCNNPNDPSFHNYGGRGIRVHPDWDDFSKFLADMGPRPKGYDIDRIDNEGDYAPGNCRWVTRQQNLRNTRITRMITFNGETHPMRVWAEKLGVSHGCLKNRIDRGWSIEVALTSGRHVRGKRKSQLLNTE